MDTEKQEVEHREARNATFADEKSLGTTATRTSYAATDAGCVLLPPLLLVDTGC